MAVASLAADCEALKDLAAAFLQTQEIRWPRVYRVDRLEEDIWWLAFMSDGKAQTAICFGVGPPKWTLARCLPGWPVPT